MNDIPQTLLEAMLPVKWADGKPVCPKCGGDQIGIIVSRSMLQCKGKGCRKQFSVKVGTIFEDSPIGLDKWFVAIWCIANAKNGISSHELGRALGVQQKTAWFMLHRIRLAMHTKTFRKLNGEVEGDETFIGGKAANMHKRIRERKIRGRGTVGKAIVQGLLERTVGDNASEVRAAACMSTGWKISGRCSSAGLPAFQSLLGKLARVPKRELDREVAKARPRGAGTEKRNR